MTKHNEGLGVVCWSRLVGGGRGVRLGLRVGSGSLVGDISDVSVISVGAVLHVLDSAIGKSHGVSTLDVAGTIGGLLGVEVGLGVVISHGVGEGVGGNLIGVGLGLVGWGSVVSNWGRTVSGGDHSSRGSSSQTGGDDEDLAEDIN